MSGTTGPTTRTRAGDELAPKRPLAERVHKRLRGKLLVLPLIVLILWTIGPVVWAISASFKPSRELFGSVNIWPENPTLTSYQSVLFETEFFRFFLNSVLLSLSSMTIAISVSALAGYGFSRYAFKWRHALLLLVLIPRLVPRISLVVPLYQVLNSIGLLDSYVGLIVVYSATAVPLSTWILAGFFHGLPREIEEAAEVDGASTFQRFFKIALPLAAPGLLVVGVLAMREAWNEFPFVLAFTSSAEMRTLPYQLFLLRDTIGIPDWSIIQAFTILSIAPLLVLYLAFEKQIVAGLTSGAVK